MPHAPSSDGISTPSGMFTSTVRKVKTAADAPLTIFSMEKSTVSSVCVLVMIADIPPASSTTMAGPIMSYDAPAAIRRTVSFSPLPATMPTSTEARMNSIASCGNHQFSSNQNGCTPDTLCVA